MTTVADANSILIAIALIVGLLVGWWIFKRAPAGEKLDAAEKDSPDRVSAPAAAPTAGTQHRARRADGPEGNSIVDQGAAATADVAGEVLGVRVHDELQGAGGPPDNLEVMKGVGPKFVARLHEHGITRFEQLARLSSNEVAILDDKMGPFKGRLARDRVTEQASYLARGDRDGFEAKFGKLGDA